MKRVLSSYQIGVQWPQHVSDALRNNTVRQILSSSLCISLYLSHSTLSYFIQTLTELDGSFNQIGVQWPQHVTDALRNNTVRQILSSSLSSNSFLFHTDTLETGRLFQSNRR